MPDPDADPFATGAPAAPPDLTEVQRDFPWDASNAMNGRFAIDP